MRKLRFVDLFCGAGGVSEGIERAGHEVVACVNHDINAIKSHLQNHPSAKHYIEDIRTLDLSGIVELVKKIREQYPEDLVCLWASLECTNHSRAKGGQSRDADSRTLAEHLFRYIDDIDPDYVWIENVREFMDWGPLQPKTKLNALTGEFDFVHDKKGDNIWVPVKELKGIDFERWVNKVKDKGYNYQHRVLDCANYDCYTHRIRYFGQFSKPGLPVAWPQPVNMKKSIMGIKPLKPVKEVLDLNDLGEDIFERKKPLVEATLKRIYAGLHRFVPKGENGFIAKYYGTGDNVSSLEQPCGTLTTKDRMNLVNVQHSFFKGQDEAPVTPERHQFMINPQFGDTGRSIDRPCFTLIAKMDKRPPYLVDVSAGDPSVVINEDDSEYTRKIKQFMIDHNIRSVKRRLLRIDELLRIQGFGDQYKLIGTQAEQKKYIGNSVPPPMVKHLIEASAAVLKKEAAALTLF
jgi:DNA (cytosine-5)-methyltransferase 1